MWWDYLHNSELVSGFCQDISLFVYFSFCLFSLISVYQNFKCNSRICLAAFVFIFLPVFSNCINLNYLFYIYFFFLISPLWITNHSHSIRSIWFCPESKNDKKISKQGSGFFYWFSSRFCPKAWTPWTGQQSMTQTQGGHHQQSLVPAFHLDSSVLFATWIMLKIYIQGCICVSEFISESQAP